MSPTIEGYSDFRQLDRGGFSTVYVATRDELGQRVAVKVLQIEMTDLDAVRRFQRECTHTGRLTNHPNAVTALDAGVTGEGHPFLTTPYHAQGSLARQLQEHGPLPVDDVLAIGVQVAGALATAHQEGIRHHDVKPENILLNDYGDPVLADFGISRLATSPGYTSTLHFTPNHVAPEVLEFGELTDEVDVYSLASTLFHLVEGRPPFVADGGDGRPDVGALRSLKRTTTPRYSSRTPMPLRAALDAALAPVPSDRPTATEFANTLRACQRARGTEPTRLAVVSPWARPGGGVEVPPAPAPPSLPQNIPVPPSPEQEDGDRTWSGTVAASTIAVGGRSPAGAAVPSTPAPAPTAEPSRPAHPPTTFQEGSAAGTHPPESPPAADPASHAGVPASTSSRRARRVGVAAAAALLLAGIAFGALRVGASGEDAGGESGEQSATTAGSVPEPAAAATGELPPVPDPPVGLADCPPPPEAQVEVADARFDPSDPPLPTDLAVQVTSTDSVRIGWEDPSDGEVTHLLALRCRDDDGGEVQIRFYGAGLPERLDLSGIDTSVAPCVAVGLVARFSEGIGQLWPGDPWVCADPT